MFMSIENILEKGYKSYRTINGGKCTIGQRVGYCWLEKHRGYITKQIMEEHECLEKKCPFFQKYEDAPYWREKEKRKKDKQNRKELEKLQKEKEQHILNLFYEETIDLTDFAIVGIKKEGNAYVVSFVTLNWIPVQKITDSVRKKINEKLLMREIKTNYQQKCALLDKYERKYMPSSDKENTENQ